MQLPSVAPVHQALDATQVEDVPCAVQRGLWRLSLATRIRPGMQIALAVGSRDISCLLPIVTTTLDFLKGLGAEPYLLAAMGSHGSGTVEGQRAILRSYGLHEGNLQVPVMASTQAVRIGEAKNGMPLFVHALALQADGLILINRIKAHTAFRGRWESGLFKLLAVGLGGSPGAANMHRWGLSTAIPKVARLLLQRLPILAGIGIVENGYHQPAQISVLPANRIEQEEPGLLERARQLAPKLPFNGLDLLVVARMGKDISGTGMDLNVIGIWRRNGGPVTPRIDCIGVLDLTDASHGNAAGVGHADLITQRLRDKIDLRATRLNCLTSRNYAGAKIPITVENDRNVFQVGLSEIDPDQARLMLIRDTLSLDRCWVSAALLPLVESDPSLTRLGPPQPLAFNQQGHLRYPE